MDSASFPPGREPPRALRRLRRSTAPRGQRGGRRPGLGSGPGGPGGGRRRAGESLGVGSPSGRAESRVLDARPRLWLDPGPASEESGFPRGPANYGVRTAGGGGPRVGEWTAAAARCEEGPPRGWAGPTPGEARGGPVRAPPRPRRGLAALGGGPVGGGRGPRCSPARPLPPVLPASRGPSACLGPRAAPGPGPAGAPRALAGGPRPVSGSLRVLPGPARSSTPGRADPR